MSRDQKFFDMYSLVLGVLAALGLAFLVLAMKVQDMTQGIYTRDAAEYQASVLERIQPRGQVYLPGEEQGSSSPLAEAAELPTPVATVMTGPQVYNEACSFCHGAGVGGAPILGDKAQWVERVAQGNAMLIQHALEGFTGSTGFMPAKGGRADLSDAEITSAVDFMIAELD